MNYYLVFVKYTNGETVTTTAHAIDGYYAIESIRSIANKVGSIKSISARKVRIPQSA
jgi:hypothetical protein